MTKRKKPVPLAGKAGKDALMPEALEQAKKGLCATFNDVLRALESRGLDPFPLRLHATAADRDRIERLCRQTREIMFPKRRR